MQLSLSKLPGTPWVKYPGEKHLPGYSYCGPGTRLDIRLDDKNQPRPGEYPLWGGCKKKNHSCGSNRYRELKRYYDKRIKDPVIDSDNDKIIRMPQDYLERLPK